MLNQHEQPAVISAIMKQQMTHRMRMVGLNFSHFICVHVYMHVCVYIHVDLIVV